MARQAITKPRVSRLTRILQTQVRLQLEELISNVVFSHIDRRYGSDRVSLFLCHVSPSCPCAELLLYRDSTRIDIDLNNGNVRIWTLEYAPGKPDVVIENLVTV